MTCQPTYTDADVQAAAEAIGGIRPPDVPMRWAHDDARAALDAVAPAIAGRAVAEFVNRMSVVYRSHSSKSIREDEVLAVREFGVDPSAFYDEPSEQDRLRTESNLRSQS